MKNAILIYNPFAGTQPARRGRNVQEAAAVLRRAGIALDLAATSSVGDATQLARSAVKAGHDLIVVCGGDGTINEVVNGMVPSRVPLAILPGGTANIVARELGVPSHIVSAAREMTQWSPVQIKLGQATWKEKGTLQQRNFVAVAGIGFDAGIIPHVRMDSKLQLGVLIYAWEAVRELFRYRFPSFQCVVNGSQYPATFAVLQRSRHYAGWLRVAPSQGLCEPELACCLFQSARRRRYLLYALTVLTHTHSLLCDVRKFAGDNAVHFEKCSEEPVTFELDGELAGEIPAIFEIAPDTLTVLAPHPLKRLGKPSRAARPTIP